MLSGLAARPRHSVARGMRRPQPALVRKLMMGLLPLNVILSSKKSFQERKQRTRPNNSMEPHTLRLILRNAFWPACSRAANCLRSEMVLAELPADTLELRADTLEDSLLDILGSITRSTGRPMHGPQHSTSSSLESI